MIRPVSVNDAEAIARIFNHYILATTDTFEKELVTAQIMETRIQTILAKSLPWFVVEKSQQVVGYTYASPWRNHAAYEHTVESSIYLDMTARQKGLGALLYSTLLEALRGLNIHAVIGVITLHNEACVALHEKFGFQKVGVFKEVGRKFDQWVDIECWQLRY